MTLKDLTLFLPLSAIWGASFLFMQLAVPDFGILPTAAGRVGMAAAVLLLVLWLRGLGGVLRQHWRATFIVGVFNAGIPLALYAFAVSYLSTGLAGILNASAPMFGALVAWVWLKDRPDGSRIVGLLVGLAGVAMLATDKGGLRPGVSGAPAAWAVLACLGACLCYGIAASFTKRYLAGLPSLVTATGSMLGGTVVLALPALWHGPTQWPGATAWMALVSVAVLCTGVAYILYFRLIEQAGPAHALTVTFMIPVFAMGYGAAFLDETITVWMVASGLVIVAGTALSTGLIRLPRARAATAPPP